VFILGQPGNRRAIADIMDAGLEQLLAAGLRRYEISAHTRPGHACRHNRNYWEFGDYLGIGAGAHAKLTRPDGRILRSSRPRHPDAYIKRANAPGSERLLAEEELPVEFMLNALRLDAGVPAGYFAARTGLSLTDIAAQLTQARERGLLAPDMARLRPTPLGLRFLNELLAIFEP